VVGRKVNSTGVMDK